jgi:hypothetical protein
VKTVTRVLPTTINIVPVSAPPLTVMVSPARPVVEESELMTGLVLVSTNCSVPVATVSNLRNPTSIVDPIADW